MFSLLTRTMFQSRKAGALEKALPHSQRRSLPDLWSNAQTEAKWRQAEATWRKITSNTAFVRILSKSKTSRCVRRSHAQKMGTTPRTREKKPNAGTAHPHAELQHTKRSACGNKRHTRAVIANLRIFRASMTTNDWRLLKKKNKYTSQFAFHAKAKTTLESQSNVLNAVSKRRKTNLASNDSVAKITRRGDVCNANTLRAKDARTSPSFRKKHLTSVSHVYFHHVNAVLHDLKAQNIEAPTCRHGLAANVEKLVLTREPYLVCQYHCG